MQLRSSERIRIREYIRGVMAGVMSSTDELLESSLDDSWFYFTHKLAVNLCLDDDGYWQAAVYAVRHGHVDAKDWCSLKLNL